MSVTSHFSAIASAHRPAKPDLARHGPTTIPGPSGRHPARGARRTDRAAEYRGISTSLRLRSGTDAVEHNLRDAAALLDADGPWGDPPQEAHQQQHVAWLETRPDDTSGDAGVEQSPNRDLDRRVRLVDRILIRPGFDGGSVGWCC